MKRPLIQLAIDLLEDKTILQLCIDCAPYVDIVELGTPCIKYNGIQILKDIVSLNLGNPILADLKTMDAGEYESTPFYQEGAAICTVLGSASPETIQGVVSAARRHQSRCQVDLINIVDKKTAALNAAALGVDIIGIHTGIDSQQLGHTPFSDLSEIVSLNTGKQISVAGGITADTAPRAAELGADIIVVGGYITSASNPASAARSLQEALHSSSHGSVQGDS